MATPFAGIETLINDTALVAVANATLTWGTSSADGVFRKPSAGLLGDLVQGDLPTFTGLTAQIGTLTYGEAVAISSVDYTVARNEPDGAGVTVLTLKNA